MDESGPDTHFVFQGDYFTFGVDIEKTLDALLELDSLRKCTFYGTISEDYLQIYLNLKRPTYFWRKGWFNPFCGLLPTLLQLGFNREQIFYFSQSKEKSSCNMKLKKFLEKVIPRKINCNETQDSFFSGRVSYFTDDTDQNAHLYNVKEVLKLHNSFVASYMGIDFLEKEEVRQQPLQKLTKKVGAFPAKGISLARLYDQVFQDFRSENFMSLKDCRTLYLIYDEMAPDGLVPINVNTNPYLWEIGLNIFEQVRKIYGDGYVGKAFFSMLAPGGKIGSHFDIGWGFVRQHRFHWVINTNDRVNFIINSIPYRMNEGEIWEIDNKQIHSVENNGDCERVHFIFDYFVFNENIGSICHGFEPGTGDFKVFNYFHKLKID